MRRVHFDVTDSTNAQPRRLVATYPGVLVTAEEQYAGRGGLGCARHSPRGGVWMTIAWPMGAGLLECDIGQRAFEAGELFSDAPLGAISTDKTGTVPCL